MTDHAQRYWGQHQVDPEALDLSDVIAAPPGAELRYLDDYWGSGGRPALPIEQPDPVAWTIRTAEDTAQQAQDGADVVSTTPDDTVPQNPPDARLVTPPLNRPGPHEDGYGDPSRPVPIIQSPQGLEHQRIITAIAERLVAETRALLVQPKAADNAHLETYPFGATIVPAVQLGYVHRQNLGYRIVASGSGLYVGESISVGQGNQGIPIPTGTTFLELPANMDLWVSSAGVALAQATSVYLITLIMGTTTL